jgi:capsule polysaccharide export protein KpsE/RkpR
LTYLHFKQPRYLATSKFTVKTSEDKAAGQLRNLAALAGINVGGGSSISPEAIFSELLLDDEFLENILRKKWSVGGDSFDIPSLWRLRPDTLKPDWRYRLEKQQVEKLRDGDFIKLEKTKSSGISMLKTLFPDPSLACQVNVYVLKLFDEFMVRDQITQAGEKRKFIADRIGEIERDLRRSEEQLADFQMKNKNVTIPTVLMEQMRLKRNMDINQELYLQLKKQFEIAKIEEKNDQPVIQLISKPVQPVSPFKPNRKLVMAAALAGGILAGLFLIAAQYAFAALRRGRGAKAA